MHIVELHDFNVTPEKTPLSYIWECDKPDVRITIRAWLNPPNTPVAINVHLSGPGYTKGEAFGWYAPACTSLSDIWKGMAERLILYDVVCKPLSSHQEPTLDLPDLDS